MLADVRAAGSGINTWRVRVNLFTDAVEPNGLVTPCADALLSEVGSSREQRMPGEAGVDRGYGWEKRPVIGFNFWVRADDPGTATETAVDTARRAAESASAGQVGPDIAVIVISPADAVTMPLDDFVGVD